MNIRVGTCSLCGGDVMGFRGAWGATIPPPKDTCSRCGAVEASDVIQMVKAPEYHKTSISTVYIGTTTGTITFGEQK